VTLDGLFSETKLGEMTLQNHIVMAPLTRCRAIDNVANALMATYYGQRASVGLIITEGTSPSTSGLGYARIPGLFSLKQVEGWKLVTEAVHAKGAKIFCQLMHTGRISHALNLPGGSRVLAPSAVACSEQMYTDKEGMQDLPEPEEMDADDIESTVNDYGRAASNAIKAGFDGVEMHAANGYLLEQFFRPSTNQRDDAYGGSVEHRARFVLEAVQAACDAIGKDKVGVRISPFGVFNEMPPYAEMEEDYRYLVEELNKIGIAYLHIVDHSAMGAPEIPASMKKSIRDIFKGTLILSGGYNAERAAKDVDAGNADLIAVGVPMLSNPDLVDRWKNNKPLNEVDFDTFYTADEKGYTDYPTAA
jgi:N-ethylmaleimide reductase